MTEKIRVAVLLGGDSSERPISIKTGRAVAAALSPERFAVETFDIAAKACDAVDDAPRVAWRDLANRLSHGGFDVVLPALHGGWGEDGTLQTLLEVAGLAYVGSPPRASVLTMDKAVAKAILTNASVPAPRGDVFYGDDESVRASEFERAAVQWQPPCVVKPNRGGSSIAITIFRAAVDDWPAALRRALEAAWNDGSPALIEELIEGREITAAVLGEEHNARALPLLEIVPCSEGGWYDYDAKYQPGGSQHLTPPRLPETAQQRVRELALRAHRVLGCRGVTRSDFMVDESGAPFFLEINTVPGMTATSLVPDAARAAGLSFEQLIEQLIMDTLRRR